MSELNAVRAVDGVNFLDLNDVWTGIEGVEPSERLSRALEIAGCEFLDDDRKLIANSSISLVGIGGIPYRRDGSTDDGLREYIEAVGADTTEMMGNSAAMSYLNSGEKTREDLFQTVTELGHFSVGHSVSVNLLLAGISQAAELELSLQRDIVHLSKLTNARTRVQSSPPLVVGETSNVEDLLEYYKLIEEMAAKYRGEGRPDELEYANSLFPSRKATMLLLTGDLSNLRKLTSFKDDEGKERELREVVGDMDGQLGVIWPKLFNKRGEQMSDTSKEIKSVENDYFAPELLGKLDEADPVFAAYEAQDVSRAVGFDFDNFQEVVPRALDEIRETIEALGELPDYIEHYGDEIADIMFSVINLSRHAGLLDLPTMSEIIAKVDENTDDTYDPESEILEIGEMIKTLGIQQEATLEDDFTMIMLGGYVEMMKKCVEIAQHHSFDAEELLRDNVKKYLIRCEAIETLAAKDGKNWSDLASNNEIIDYWKKAKSILR